MNTNGSINDKVQRTRMINKISLICKNMWVTYIISQKVLNKLDTAHKKNVRCLNNLNGWIMIPMLLELFVLHFSIYLGVDSFSIILLGIAAYLWLAIMSLILSCCCCDSNTLIDNIKYHSRIKNDSNILIKKCIKFIDNPHDCSIYDEILLLNQNHMDRDNDYYREVYNGNYFNIGNERIYYNRAVIEKDYNYDDVARQFTKTDN